MLQKRPIISFSGQGVYLIALKVVVCLACWCWGTKKTHQLIKYGLTTLIAFTIPNITLDVGHSFNLHVGLQGPGWLCVLGIPPRADVPLSTPAARATDNGQRSKLRLGSDRAPCVPQSREHEERPGAGREKNSEGPKNDFHIYICLQGSPSGRVLK